MDFFTALFGNKVLLAAIISWFVAQLLKVATELIINKKLNFKRFVGSGGMPSSHSSFVMAALVVIGRIDGIASTTFALAFVFSLIVMYDATGVRRSAGQQAEVLNWMIEHWNSKDESDKITFEKKLKELIGHTPIEVFAGAFLGIIIGMLIRI